MLFTQLLLLALVAAWADGYVRQPRVWLGCLALVLSTAAMALQAVPIAVTAAAYAANAGILLIVVVPQLMMNSRRGSTGQLSIVVVAMTLCGITSRVYTTWLEVEDPALRATVTLNWVLWASLMLQFWIYRDRSNKVRGGPKPKVVACNDGEP